MRTVIQAAVYVMLLAAITSAATVSVYPVHVGLSPNESHGRAVSAPGIPPFTRIHEFAVTTSADILLIDRVLAWPGSNSSFYQVPANEGGSDSEPPLPLFETIFPNLQADTWITTPGSTAIDGPIGDPFRIGASYWFDANDNGPQSNFVFARFGLTGDWVGATFQGRIGVRGAGAPEWFPFFFTLHNDTPEPPAAVLGLVALAAAPIVCRRRGSYSAP